VAEALVDEQASGERAGHGETRQETGAPGAMPERSADGAQPERPRRADRRQGRPFAGACEARARAEGLAAGSTVRWLSLRRRPPPPLRPRPVGLVSRPRGADGPRAGRAAPRLRCRAGRERHRAGTGPTGAPPSPREGERQAGRWREPRGWTSRM
jgi:hypothetical protein